MIQERFLIQSRWDPLRPGALNQKNLLDVLPKDPARPFVEMSLQVCAMGDFAGFRHMGVLPVFKVGILEFRVSGFRVSWA